jgi:hypothetical protein
MRMHPRRSFETVTDKELLCEFRSDVISAFAVLLPWRELLLVSSALALGCS